MNSAYRIDFAIPISKPRSSANPRRRPKQEYPDLSSSSDHQSSDDRGLDA